MFRYGTKAQRVNFAMRLVLQGLWSNEVGMVLAGAMETSSGSCLSMVGGGELRKAITR